MRNFILYIFLISSCLLHGNEVDSLYRTWLPDLQKFGEQSRVLPSEDERNAAADSFIVIMKELVRFPEAMHFTFEGVPNLSVLTSPDEKLRTITFMVPQSGLVYEHYGFLLYQDEEYKHLFLKNGSMGMQSDIYRLLAPDEWLGGLYYDIVEREKGDQTVYFLMGFRQVNPNIQQKFIDAVTITDGLIRFGCKAFRIGEFNDVVNEQPPYRLILSYSTKYGATFKWNDEYEGIVMDHMSPPDASQKRFFMVYGPDFSYDALVWRDEEWHLQENITFENDVQTAPPNPDVPTGLPPRR